MDAITKYIKPEDDFLYKKGEQLGFEKGAEEEKQKVVKRLLLKKTFTNEQIAEIADVSISVVIRIRSQLAL